MSKIHAILYRSDDGKFQFARYCTFCAKQAGAATSCDGGVLFGSAYVCDPCIAVKENNSNLSLAVPSETWTFKHDTKKKKGGKWSSFTATGTAAPTKTKRKAKP